MVGSFLGWKGALLTIMLGAFIGSVAGLVLIVIRKHKMDRVIPFGPFLALGALMTTFYGPDIFHGILPDSRMTGHAFSIVIFGTLIFVLGGALLWGMMRQYHQRLGVQKENQEKTTETAFIINAFHELQSSLKEKEKELERLKALAEQRAENVESYNENTCNV